MELKEILMSKLKLKTNDITQENIEKIGALFPACITEIKENDAQGREVIRKAIDFDLLRQELSHSIVEGPTERYQIDWPGKRESLLLANAPITKTLRPVREESVNFDETENLFIEGDNLEALKLLRKSYLGKVKMIYIDPPYNTGNDFIYEDDFAESVEEYLLDSLQVDEKGNRLTVNRETNGRFHSDWLSMMHSRLRLARDLLREDGVIFISIGDSEKANLKRICDEVYGEQNFIASLIWNKNHSAQAGIFKVYHEYVLVYSKKKELIHTPKSLSQEYFEAGAIKRESERHPMSSFRFPSGVRFDAEDGIELTEEWGGVEKIILESGRMICNKGKTVEPVTLRASYTQKRQMEQFFYGDRKSLTDSRGQRIVEFYFSSTGKLKIVKERGVETPATILSSFGSQGAVSLGLARLFDMDQSPMDNPKPIKMIMSFIGWFVDKEDIVLDFFAGSSTTAHAVMQLNAEDGGNRKFIMVQLPEETDEKSAAYKAGYKTIAEISKERIRRAGKQILESEEIHEEWNRDVGFRVLKVDETNMKEVYFHPEAIDQKDLLEQVDNVKEDRTAEDLLFEVMVDWGVSLDLPIEVKTILGKEVHFVAEDALIACFDTDITEELVTELAQYAPLRLLFRDNHYADNEVKINAQQLIKQLSPNTELRSI